MRDGTESAVRLVCSFLAGLSDADSFGFPHAVVVNENPPCTLPLPNLHAHVTNSLVRIMLFTEQP